MKQSLMLIGMIMVAAFFTACGSGSRDSQESMPASMKMEESGKAGGQSAEMKSSEAWIREQPVDVAAVDENKDGFVYQDPMDWNVIADEEGKCPKCGMFLKKVTIEEAIQNLKDNGFAVK